MDDDYYEHDDYDCLVKRDAICDADCRGINHCGGHAMCNECGEVFCGYELDEDGYCVDCASKREQEEE